MFSLEGFIDYIVTDYPGPFPIRVSAEDSHLQCIQCNPRIAIRIHSNACKLLVCYHHTFITKPSFFVSQRPVKYSFYVLHT